MDKLKRCPFCGGEALLEPYRARKGYEASIQCNQCLCSMSTITYDEEETAIEDVVKAWNRRVNDASVVHGKWGDNGIAGSMLVKCSVCGFDCGANSFSYCPNCGARMRQAKRESEKLICENRERLVTPSCEGERGMEGE